MGRVISDLVAVIYTGLLLFGGGCTIKEVHDFVRYETLKQVSKPLSSSEALANALTGEKTGF